MRAVRRWRRVEAMVCCTCSGVLRYGGSEEHTGEPPAVGYATVGRATTATHLHSHHGGAPEEKRQDEGVAEQRVLILILYYLHLLWDDTLYRHAAACATWPGEMRGVSHEGTCGGQGGGAEESGGHTRALHPRRPVRCARLRHRLAFRCKGQADTCQRVPVVRETGCARDVNAEGGGALVGTAPLHTDRLLRRGHWHWRSMVVVVVDAAAGVMSRG